MIDFPSPPSPPPLESAMCDLPCEYSQPYDNQHLQIETIEKPQYKIKTNDNGPIDNNILPTNSNQILRYSPEPTGCEQICSESAHEHNNDFSGNTDKHENYHQLINQLTLDTDAYTTLDRTSIISIETATTNVETANTTSTSITNHNLDQPRTSIASSSRFERPMRPRTVVRKFQQLDQSQLISTPSPDVKIGQRIAFKEYYGNEFGTIRWIGKWRQPRQ